MWEEHNQANKITAIGKRMSAGRQTGHKEEECITIDKNGSDTISEGTLLGQLGNRSGL